MVFAPTQLGFLDETSKHGRTAWRKYGWSKRNTKCITKIPYACGKRVSFLAALNVTGFFAYATRLALLDAVFFIKRLRSKYYRS